MRRSCTIFARRGHPQRRRYAINSYVFHNAAADELRVTVAENWKQWQQQEALSRERRAKSGSSVRLAAAPRRPLKPGGRKSANAPVS